MAEKTITIGDRQITVRELTMKQIHDLTSGDDASVAATMVSLVAATTGLKKKQLMAMTASELQPLSEAMVEVNRPFLEITAAMGMEEAAQSLEKMMRNIFSVAFLP